MSKSTIEIKTAFEGCAEVCYMFQLDYSDKECMYKHICEKAAEAIAKLSEQGNPLGDLFAESLDKLNGLKVERKDNE